MAPAAGAEAELLRRLVVDLRNAIEASLRGGMPHLAVALDTARDRLEVVMADAEARATRIAIARTRAEIALEMWRETFEARR